MNIFEKFGLKKEAKKIEASPEQMRARAFEEGKKIAEQLKDTHPEILERSARA